MPRSHNVPTTALYNSKGRQRQIYAHLIHKGLSMQANLLHPTKDEQITGQRVNSCRTHYMPGRLSDMPDLNAVHLDRTIQLRPMILYKILHNP